MPQDETLDGLRLGLYSLLLAKHILPEGEQIEKGSSGPVYAVQNFINFIQFFWKIWQIRMLAAS